MGSPEFNQIGMLNSPVSILIADIYSENYKYIFAIGNPTMAVNPTPEIFSTPT
jgi:hypothetical protein